MVFLESLLFYFCLTFSCTASECIFNYCVCILAWLLQHLWFYMGYHYQTKWTEKPDLTLVCKKQSGPSAILKHDQCTQCLLKSFIFIPQPGNQVCISCVSLMLTFCSHISPTVQLLRYTLEQLILFPSFSPSPPWSRFIHSHLPPLPVRSPWPWYQIKMKVLV